jgi:hypothetical protein
MGRLAYPDKGVMGLARHKPSSQVRLSLSAAAASAVLYSAIVLFGVGSASPSALDVGGSDRPGSVVLIPAEHADTVSGSVQKLPQASPEPRRNRSTVRPDRPRPTVGPRTTPSAPSTIASPPAPTRPRETASASAVASGSPSAPLTVTAPAVPLVDTIVATVPALVPELPVALPGLPPLPVDVPLNLPG